MQAIHADITSLPVDVIVNTASSSRCADPEVVDAVHKAAGPQLKDCCSQLPRLDVGNVALTPAFRLPSKWIIHATTPAWVDGANGEPELLASCYRGAIRMAEANALHSIAFSPIGTDVDGFPMAEAIEIAVATVSIAVESSSVIGEVVFCCCSIEELARYRAVLMQPS